MNKESYISKKRSKVGSEDTIGNYTTALNHFENFLEKYEYTIEDLDTTNIHKLYTYFTNKNLAGSTVQQYLTVIQKYVREEVAEEIAEEIATFTFDTRSVTEAQLSTQTPIVTVDQYKQMIENSKDLRARLIVKLLWETGVRPKELSNIQIPQDVDRDKKEITIETAKIPIDSDRPRTRTVHYSVEMKSELREWLDYEGRSKYKTSARSDYLIVTENSPKITPNYINTIILETAKRAGIKKEYSPNDSEKNQYFPNCRHFRNSFATYRNWKGMDLETLRQLMGHHDVSVTSRYVKDDSRKQSEKNDKYRPKIYTDESLELGKNL